MPEHDYRAKILERLCERDRFVGQFKRIIDSYASVTESLNVVLNSDKRRRYDSAAGETSDDTKEIQNLKEELSELYKKRSKNDQLLIDAQNKITDLEANLSIILEAKSKLEQQLKETQLQLQQVEKKLKEIQEERDAISDEVITLKAENSSLERRFIECDQERVQLLDHIKQIKEQNINLLNEFNEKDQLIRMEKLKLEIGEAIKSSSSKEDLERKPSGAGSIGSGASCFDEMPSRCFFRMDCDESGEVNDCCFNKTGSTFFTCGNDKIIRVYQLNGERATLSSKLVGFTSSINRLDVHPEMPLILGASNDKTVRVYGLDDQRLRSVLTGHSDKVSSARFLSKANRIISGSLDRTVKVWDSCNVRCIKTYFPGSIATDVAVSEYSQILISSHYDKKLRFWDSRTESSTSEIRLDGKITSMSLSSDGNKLLCCCRDETLSLFDLRLRQIEHIYSADTFRTSYDYCKCLITPSLGYVMAGSAEGQIFIWNLNSTKLEKILSRGGHDGHPIYSLAHHPTERILISTDRRKTCCLWE